MKVKIQLDKKLHFIAVYLLTGFCHLLTKSLLITTSIVVIISVGKEIYDMYKPKATGFSWGDLLADAIGYGLAIGALYLGGAILCG